ncbi:hypothetical protein KI387_041095, partial [Taxus chinensis]
VNQALVELIEASESNTNPLEWVKLSQDEIGLKIKDVLDQYQGDKEDESHLSTCFYGIWRYVQTILFYFLGLFLISWKYVKSFLVCFNMVKVEQFHTPIESHDQDSTRTEQPSALVPQY